MLHSVWVAAVQEALRQARQQIQPLVGLAQLHGASVGADRAAVETGHHLPLSAGFKSETGLVTLCHSEGRPLFGSNCCVETQLCQMQRLFASSSVRNRG